MNKTLINASEVIDLTTVDSTTDHNLIEKKIFSAEFNALCIANTGVLGRECYKLMLADLVNPVCYDETIAYTTDQVVIVDGQNYKALEDVTGVYPIGSDKWEIVGKFSTEKWQNLWDCGLGLLIANAVVYRAYPNIRIQLDSQGAVKKKSDKFEAADRHEAKTNRESYNDEVETYVAVVLDFLYENKKDYPCYPFEDDCGCDTEPKSSNNNLGVYLDD